MLSNRSLLGGSHRLTSGKIRDLFRVDDETVLMVASDRISAFDAVLATEIPDKGSVLTAMSLWWFEQLAAVVPNHVITANVDEYPASFAPYRDELRGRSMLCRRLDMIGIECVVRGYLAGSGLVDYKQAGAVSGHALPAGLNGRRALAANSSEPIQAVRPAKI